LLREDVESQGDQAWPGGDREKPTQSVRVLAGSSEIVGFTNMRLLKPFRMPMRSLFIGAALLITVGLGSLGIVWLRLEISQVANDSRRLEKKVSDSARELRGFNAKRAKALTPSSLKSLVAGRLAKPSPSSVFFVNSTEFQRRQNLPPPFFPRSRDGAGLGSSQPLASR
jgi:hypothetical protein